MRTTSLVSILLLLAGFAAPEAQRRGAAPRTGPVTFAVFVADPSGGPVGDVRVSLAGPVTRTSRTERGRTVFESLPSGEYKFTFEKPGYTPVEQTVTGKGSAPIDVKVTLVPEPAPAEPLPPPPPPAPKPEPSDVKMAVLDMPAFIEKNYIGRAAGKTTPMGCATGGSATLLQINEPLAQHVHDDADEFIYVIAGQGMAQLSGREEALGPAVFLMVPRGMPHTVTAGPKKPLVVMSVRAGDKCR